MKINRLTQWSHGLHGEVLTIFILKKKKKLKIKCPKDRGIIQVKPTFSGSINPCINPSDGKIFISSASRKRKNVDSGTSR